MEKSLQFAINEVVTTLWIVTRPGVNSTIQDIVFEVDFDSISRQIKGGLNPSEVIGIWTSEDCAHVVADELLKRSAALNEIAQAIDEAINGGPGV